MGVQSPSTLATDAWDAYREGRPLLAVDGIGLASRDPNVN
jgi:hypothetical protein